MKYFQYKLVFTSFTLLLLFSFSRVAYCSSTIKTCAILQSTEKHVSTLKDSSVVGNLGAEYASANQRWSDTTASWEISDDCVLQFCREPYLMGSFCSNVTGPDIAPASGFLSASCNCPKDCSCSSVHLKRDVCARAYFNSNGCNSCNTPYTELKKSTLTFPEIWVDEVKSFLVRPGCKITAYDEEDQEGNSQLIEGSFVENWTGTLGSYECQCDDTQYQPKTKPPKPTNYPESVEVPITLDDIVTQLRQRNYDHQGLQAAFSSGAHGRSSKAAYILLIGSSGAGKSSAINILLGKNATLAGEQKSTTSDILEFRMPVPVDKYGVTNSELVIIDTPGLEDTRGIEQDALFLATLDDYLAAHSELKNKIPNLILVFHAFTDNRFHGEAAKFVKMVRGLDSFRTRITDENFSNVLFVYSHLCSETKDLQRNPLPRLMKFEEVIKKYSLFPQPILTAVVENKAFENEVPMINGNYELPNKEYFPQNLLDKFETITTKGQDYMGQAIIQAAFSEFQENLNISQITFPLVNSGHSKVAIYLSILTAAAYNVESTEVSVLLADAFKTMSASLKTQHPSSLEYLQKFFNVRNIRSKADVPKTTVAILELIHDMEKNDAISHLLDKGLSLKPPMFPRNVGVGYSYNILQDSILSVSPFVFENYQTSSTGFMLPSGITGTESSPAIPVNMLKSFNTKKEYVEFRIQNFGVGPEIVNDTSIFTGVTGNIKNGFYVKDSMCSSSSSCSYIATRMYPTFAFQLDENTIKVNTVFKNRVVALPEFNETKQDNVKLWDDFFREYGTHVVYRAVAGGKIHVTVSSPSSSSLDTSTTNVFKSIEFADNLTSLVTGDKINPKEIFSTGVSHTLTFFGGNQAFHTADLTKLKFEDASKLLKKWEKSIRFSPDTYPHEIIPLSTAVKSLGDQVASKLDNAMVHLMSSTLKYDPRVDEENARKQKELEAELLRKQKEREEELKRLEQERIRKMEEQKERERKALEEQRRRQEEERQREVERKRQEELQRQRQREEEERQRREHEAWVQRQREVEEYRRREREAERRRQEEQQRAQLEWARQVRIWQEEAERNRRRGSCLREGTKILLADYTEKSVEAVKVGDMILDMDLQPTRVLGISYEFLLSQKFYGFDNQSYFFTDSHLFVGLDETKMDLKLYAKSTAHLFSQNPLMEYLNVKDFDSDVATSIVHFDSTTKKSVSKPVLVFPDPKLYSPETLVYFIQVDSPTGTYFADGYVCRHEVPPLTVWPNTMSTLFMLYDTEVLERISKLPYTLETIEVIDRISDDLEVRVQNVIDDEQLLLATNNAANINNTTLDATNKKRSFCSPKSLDDYNLDDMVGKVFQNPTLSAMSMELYGASGKVMATFLDNPDFELSNCKVSKLQQKLFSAINHELKLSFNKHAKSYR